MRKVLLAVSRAEHAAIASSGHYPNGSSVVLVDDVRNCTVLNAPYTKPDQFSVDYPIMQLRLISLLVTGR